MMILCDECETVAHCLNNGCMPKQPNLTKGNQIMFTKDTLKNLLAENTLEVLFIKKDGEQRLMTCTTMSDNIPAEFQPKGDIKEDKHPTQVRAYDINAEGWRSFLVTNVIEVRIL